MSKHTQKMNDGAYIVSDAGSWVVGRYDSKEAALLACTKEPSALAKLWADVLASGREVLTLQEVGDLP